MHLPTLIVDLAIILVVASVVTLIFRRLNQPVVLGYLIAGVIVGPHTGDFPSVSDIPNIQAWGELGVIFLMFSLGLEFSFRKLARTGIASAGTAIVEISLMLPIGYFAGALLGWSAMDRLFLGAMLAISSTTIIIKALRDLKLSTRRFAEVVFGVLIVEDLGAVLLLVALSSIAVSQTISGIVLFKAAMKLVLVAGTWFIAGYFVVPRFVRYVGKRGSEETLTVVSVGLCLLLVVVAHKFGYSAALGAFIMGSILAETAEVGRIEKQIEPLRDLFAAVFFVSVGMQLDPVTLSGHGKEIFWITLVTIVGKLFSTTLGALVSGQRLSTAIQVGFSLAQVGEFSFIIGGLGAALGVISPQVFPVIVVVSIVTTFTTPYFIRWSDPFAKWLEARLPTRIIAVINRYSLWVTERENDASKKRDFFRSVLKWGINALLVSVIFVVMRQVMQSDRFTMTLGWLLAVVSSMPFIWGMLMAFARVSHGRTLFWSRFAAVAWIGLLSGQFFPLKYAALITLGAVSLVSAIFYRQLEASYRWFESRFASTFESNGDHAGQSELSRLAPWDAHLVKLKVHPNSEIVSLTIAESRLRSNHGVNVVVIQRGLQSIVAPGPNERLLPNDDLLALATDEQIDAIRPKIELPNEAAVENPLPVTTLSFDLRGLRVTSKTHFEGKTIRDSRIRERFGAIVVGIERSGKRVLGPESTLKLQVDDLVWLVGEKESLDRLFHEAGRDPSFVS
jgi:CPA2 family monovalent cation:H+ antiporter-2